MVEVGCEVLLLADRLAGRADLESLRGLLDGLARLGHDPAVLCPSAPPDHGLDDLTECPGLARRWQRPWAVRGLNLDQVDGHPRIMHVLSLRMAEPALAIAERWRIPYLLGVDEFPGRDARLRLSRAWCRGLVVPNRELAAVLAGEFGVPLRAIREVGPGVAPPGRTSGPIDAGPSLGRVPVVGAAGPLVGGSGFATFLNAARKVVDMGVDAEFLIAGHGEDEGDLRRRAERLRIAERLTFADDLPGGLSFWDVLDVYCQASTSPTVGRPLMTALAAGIPSIATDVDGLRSLVEPGETGLVVPRGDSSALAGSIVALLLDRSRAKSLGDAARLAASRDFHPDREAAQLDALYRAVCAEGLGPQPSGLASRILGPDAGTGNGTGRSTGGLEGDAPAPWAPSERS